MEIRENSIARNNLLPFRIIGHAWFLILGVYCVVYVAERFTYVDSAWQFFERINSSGFIFPSGRYGVIFSQIPVFLAQKLGASFTVLAYTFSLSYVLLYYFIWYVCTSILRNPTAGLAIVFCTFLGVREGFLHPVTETQQCLFFSVLLYAILSHQGLKQLKGVVLASFVAILILLTHPVGLFTGGFAVLLSMVELRNFRNRIGWLTLIILVSFSVWRFFFPVDTYDAAIYDQLKGNSESTEVTNGALNFLRIHFLNFYWLPELAGLVALLWLAFKKEWTKLLLLVTGVAGYLIIIALTFSNGDSSILMERAFLPACFMIALVIAGVIIQTQFSRKWIPVAVCIFFLVNGVRYINNGCLMFKKRTAYLDELIIRGHAGSSDKYYIAKAKVDFEKINIPWALGTETLLYSTFKYGKPVTIAIENEVCDSTSVRLTSFYCLPINNLNPEYFTLSLNPYQPLP